MTLAEMVAGYPAQINQLTDTIAKLDEQIAVLIEQKDVLDDVLDGRTTAALNRLMTKFPGKLIRHPFGGWGVSNLTDFEVYEVDGEEETILYQYEGIGWDSDVEYLGIKSTFDFTYDHLNEPLGLTGTYGINDMIAKLTQGKGISVANKTKYTDAITVYGELI